MPDQPKRGVKEIEALVAPICEAHGVELVLLHFARIKGGGVLKVLIDRPKVGRDGLAVGSGVSVDDCKQVSRDISTALDLHEDMVPGTYQLEVSSPGVERPLVKLSDFERFAGREAKVQTKMPIAERRNFTGKLVAVADDHVKIVDESGKEFSIPHGEIARAHLVHRF